MSASRAAKQGSLLRPARAQVSLHPQLASVWQPTAWEATLALRTGRTHQVCSRLACLLSLPEHAEGLRCLQIRAQFAAVGCPLFGDEMYALAPEAGPSELLSSENLGSMEPPELADKACCVLALRVCSSAPSADPTHGEQVEAASRRLQLKEPQVIGLQACWLQIKLEPSLGLPAFEETFEAGSPWWRPEAAAGNQVVQLCLPAAQVSPGDLQQVEKQLCAQQAQECRQQQNA